MNFTSGDIIQYVGKPTSKADNFELFIITGFVDDAMVVFSLGLVANLNEIQYAHDNLMTSMDVKGDYENSFVKITSIGEMKRNNIWDVRA